MIQARERLYPFILSILTLGFQPLNQLQKKFIKFSCPSFSMQNKNLFRIILIPAGFVLFLMACKHTIPDSPFGNNSGGGAVTITDSCSTDTVYFQQSILPVIISNCAKSGCHDAISHKEGFNLTNYSNIMKLVNPGNPGGSKLYTIIITNNIGDRMPPPPDPKMSQDQIDLIYKWIKQGARNNACTGGCDTAVFTYSGAVKPLISTQCQGCHSGTAASGGIDLSTYTGVKTMADNGKLWGAVHKDPGFVAMPPAGNGLSSCQLTQIRKWIDSGSPNN